MTQHRPSRTLNISTAKFLRELADVVEAGQATEMETVKEMAVGLFDGEPHETVYHVHVKVRSN